MWETWMECLAPGLSLTQTRLSQPQGSELGDDFISLSLPLSIILPFKKQIFKEM